MHGLATEFRWNDANVAFLKERWAEGVSAGVIAGELRTTRNSVIGKANRLGLPGRVTHFAKRSSDCKKAMPTRGTRAQGAITGIVHRAKRQRAEAAGTAPVAFLLPKELPAEAIPLAQRKTLFELTSKTCRWPYGDPGTPGFFFCGALEADNPVTPYCRFHTKLASGREANPIERQKARLAAKRVAQDAGLTPNTF